MNPFEPDRNVEFDAELREIAVPPGLHARLRRTALCDDDGLDAALRSVPLPAGFERRLQQVAFELDEVLDAALCDVAIPAGLDDRLRRTVLADDDGLDAVLRDTPTPVRLRRRLARASGAAGRLAALGRWATAVSLLVAIGLSYVGAMILMLASVYPQEPQTGPELATWTVEFSSAPKTAVAAVPPARPEPFEVREERSLPPPVRPVLDVKMVELAEADDRLKPWRPIPADPLRRADLLGDVPLDGLRDALSAPSIEFRGVLDDLDRVIEELEDPRLIGRLVPRGVRLPRVRGASWAFWLEYGVTPRVYPAAHPLLQTSMVPLDVAPTSYELARRHLAEGELPFHEDIRTEEFLAAIDYDYPQPRGGRPLELFTAAGPSPFSLGGANLLQIGVQGRQFQDQARSPATLILAVDASGSMRWGDRLGMVRRAIPELAGRLGPNDRISLVRFSREASTLVEDLGRDDADQLVAAARSLTAEGPTNVRGGLGEAIAAAHYRGASSDRTIRVVLLSDGLTGLERETADRIEVLLDKCAARGIALEVIDLGQEGPDAQLADFARAGGGKVHRATHAEEIGSALVEILTGRSQLIAENVQLRVAFNPQTVLDYRLMGHEEGLIPAPLEVDFRAGQSATALYEIRMKPGTGGSSEVATVELTWQPPDGNEGSQTIRRVIRQTGFSTSLVDAPLPLQAAAIAAQTAEVLRRSPFAVKPPSARRVPSFDLVLELAEQLDSRLEGNASYVEFMAMVRQAAEAKPYRRPLGRRGL